MSAYRRRGRSTTSGAGSRWMNLRYAGTCKVCGTSIPKGTLAYWDAGARTVTCTSLDCAESDGLTTVKPLTGPWDKRSDTRVLADRRVGAPVPSSSSDPFAKTRSRGYYGRDAGRCEDAPCCGCC